MAATMCLTHQCDYIKRSGIFFVSTCVCVCPSRKVMSMAGPVRLLHWGVTHDTVFSFYGFLHVTCAINLLVHC